MPKITIDDLDFNTEDLSEDGKLRIAQIEWIDGPDPFFNINTPEDLAQAKKRLSQGSL